MEREQEKSIYEKEVFLLFLKKSKITIDINSIKSGNPNKNEPDIICKSINGASMGFELGRLTDPTLSAASNRWKPINGEYIRTRDPSKRITIKKLKKQYIGTLPTQLLLYKENPIITPDNIIIPTIKQICDSHQHKYFKIWFMSNKNIELLYE